MVGTVHGCLGSAAAAAAVASPRPLARTAPAQRCAALLLADSLLATLAASLAAPALRQLAVGIPPETLTALTTDASGRMAVAPTYTHVTRFGAFPPARPQAVLDAAAARVDVASWTNQLAAALAVSCTLC